MLDEPKVIIDFSQPPDSVKLVHQWLEYLQGKHIESGLFKEESYVLVDIWDFAGQHLYYASTLSSYHSEHCTYWCTISASLWMLQLSLA